MQLKTRKSCLPPSSVLVELYHDWNNIDCICGDWKDVPWLLFANTFARRTSGQDLYGVDRFVKDKVYKDIWDDEEKVLKAFDSLFRYYKKVNLWDTKTGHFGVWKAFGTFGVGVIAGRTIVTVDSDLKFVQIGYSLSLTNYAPHT